MAERCERDTDRNPGGKIRLDAELIAQPTFRLVAAGHRAQVVQLFDRSINLVADNGTFFSLTLSGIAPGPFSIVVRKDSQQKLSLARILGRNLPDLKAIASEEELRVGRLSVNLSPAKKWEPRLVKGELLRRDSTIAANQIYAYLDRYAPVDSLPHEFFSDKDSWIGARLRPAWRQLTRAVRNAEPGECVGAAQLAAGVGPGLTPSGDDFLMGVTLAFWLALEEPESYIGASLAGTRGRTGRLSMALLEAAARGEAGQHWHVMAQAIADGDACKTRQATEDLLSVGHTSGADALFGFALALQATGPYSAVSAGLVSS